MKYVEAFNADGLTQIHFMFIEHTLKAKHSQNTSCSSHKHSEMGIFLLTLHSSQPRYKCDEDMFPK